jgi:hypothetical protein
MQRSQRIQQQAMEQMAQLNINKKVFKKVKEVSKIKKSVKKEV